MKPMDLKPTVAAYMAGILDGEGCIYVNRRKISGRRQTPGYGVKVAVAITNADIVEWFRNNVYLTSVCGFQPKGNRKYKWLCTWNNSAAEALLLALQPYLVIKVEQARLGLSLLKHLRTHKRTLGKPVEPEVIGWRESVKQQIATLNMRGRVDSATK